jgi:hypothetical protein
MPSGKPWSTVLAGIKVTVLGGAAHLVTVTARSPKGLTPGLAFPYFLDKGGL